MQKQTFRIDNLTFDIRLNDNPNPMPLICFFHGYKSYRNWGFIPYICEQLAENGFIALNLDFSKNGIIDELNYKFNPDIFANNTVSQEIEDANHLIDILTNNSNAGLQNFISNYWNKEIYLIGHSRGGAISLFAAENNDNIKKIALWSTVSHLIRYTDRYRENLQKLGKIEFFDSLAKQKLYTKYSYIEDLEQNREKFDMLKVISKLKQPILILYGENDLVAPARESCELMENAASSENVRILKIPKANHIYNVNHPFKGASSELNFVLNNTIDFFSEK